MKHEGKHVLSHAAIYLVARGVPGVVAFLAIPLFSRLLSPADYGRYALVMAAAGLGNALLFQWLRLSLVRYQPVYKDEPQRLQSTLLAVTLILIGVTGLIAALAYAVPALRLWRAEAAAGWLMLAAQSLFELCCESARSSLRPWRYMVMQVARSSAIIALGVGLLLIGWGWLAPLAAGVTGMSVGIAWTWGTDWSRIRLGIDREVIARLAQYGIPLSLTVALTVVISSSDRFLIAAYLGEDAAGLYSVAVDFTSQTLTLLMLAINMALFPIAVRAWENHGREAAQEQMRSNAALLMAVGLPCVVGLAILAPGVAHTFLGNNFQATATRIIPLVALGAFLAGFKAYHFDAAFQFAHRTIYQVWIVLAAAIVNVALNLIAIPRWGINGAAGASVLAYVMSIALTAWLGRRHFALPFPIAPCAQVLLAAAAMAAAILPFRDVLNPYAVAAQVAAGATIYAGVLLATNFLGLRSAIARRLFTGRAASIDLDANRLAEAQWR